jgi:hypothetical protein
MELYGSDGSLYLPDPNFFGGEVLLAKQVDDLTVIANPNHPFSTSNAKDGQGNDRANYRARAWPIWWLVLQQIGHIGVVLNWRPMWLR